MAKKIEITAELYEVDENGVKTSLSKSSRTKDVSGDFAARVVASVSEDSTYLSVTED